MTGALLLLALWAAEPPPPPPPPPPDRWLVEQPFARADGVIGRATVYLPPQYLAEPQRRFPLLVLLHGLGGSPADFVERTRLDWRLDRSPPMVVVMPDGEDGYWVDWPDGAPANRFGSLVDEARVWAEARFRTDGRRAIAGLSMGGFGALSAALRHPRTYEAAISLSGALFRSPPSGRWVYLAAFGYPGVRQWRFAFWNPLDLIRMGQARGLRVWLDCGADDRPKFTAGLKAVSGALREAGVKHTVRLRPGKHEWPVWEAGLTDSLAWLNLIWSRQ